MLPPHATVMEAALMMEIAYVTMVSTRLIAQVKFFELSNHPDIFLKF